MDKKILFVRDHYYEIDDTKVITFPHYAVGEKILNVMRTLYRKFRFLFSAMWVTFGVLLFVKSSKYDVLQQLHYSDLIDCMKRD